MKAAIIALAITLASSIAVAAPTSESPLDDSAMVIDAAGEAQIENDLRQLRLGGVEMAVILVQRLGSASIEGYAYDAAQDWSTGRAAAAVLVIAISDRKSRLEVSDALRSKFPDQRAQAILDNTRGYLRNADYTGAVRAIISEVGAAHRGVAPDFESPHPQSGLPATDSAGAGTHTPTRNYDTYRRPSPDRTYTWAAVVLGIVALFGIGALWAAAARKANFTLSHDGTVNTLQRSFIVDWLWHTAKIVGWIGFIIFIIAAASSKSSSSTSSSWGSSSTSSFGSSSGSSSSGGGFSGGSSGGSSGGGWSGGGASSSW